MRPDAGETIGLQLQFHRQRICLARIALLKLVDFSLNAGKFLDVMSQLVGQNVRLRKLAGCAEAPVQFIEESQVDVNLFVLRAIKWAGG